MPKQWTIGRHEALRELISFCYVFSIFLVLFVGNEYYFAFLME